MLAYVSRQVTFGEKSLTVGASIGVAVFPEDAGNGEDLLKNADLALYHAKSEGRGRCRHFSEAQALFEQALTFESSSAYLKDRIGAAQRAVAKYGG